MQAEKIAKSNQSCDCNLLQYAVGIYNDLGSGSNVDLCIITKGKVDYKRNVELLMGKTYSRQKPVRYAPGTTRESLPVVSCLFFIAFTIYKHWS